VTASHMRHAPHHANDCAPANNHLGWQLANNDIKVLMNHRRQSNHAWLGKGLALSTGSTWAGTDLESQLRTVLTRRHHSCAQMVQSRDACLNNHALAWISPVVPRVDQSCLPNPPARVFTALPAATQYAQRWIRRLRTPLVS
jgi:hypothetical protein